MPQMHAMGDNQPHSHVHVHPFVETSTLKCKERKETSFKGVRGQKILHCYHRFSYLLFLPPDLPHAGLFSLDFSIQLFLMALLPSVSSVIASGTRLTGATSGLINPFAHLPLAHLDPHPIARQLLRLILLILARLHLRLFLPSLDLLLFPLLGLLTLVLPLTSHQI